MTQAQEDQLQRLQFDRDKALGRLRDLNYLGGRGAERQYALAHDLIVAFNNSIPGRPVMLRLKKKHRG